MAARGRGPWGGGWGATPASASRITSTGSRRIPGSGQYTRRALRASHANTVAGLAGSRLADPQRNVVVER
ncbi:MAG TPA: hypothetical protein DEF51_42700 [Myxococcales bacterium]|nr:hypothetical protein [Myxococcales bacterium]